MRWATVPRVAVSVNGKLDQDVAWLLILATSERFVIKDNYQNA